MSFIVIQVEFVVACADLLVAVGGSNKVCVPADVAEVEDGCRELPVVVELILCAEVYSETEAVDAP